MAFFAWTTTRQSDERYSPCGMGTTRVPATPNSRSLKEGRKYTYHIDDFHKPVTVDIDQPDRLFKLPQSFQEPIRLDESTSPQISGATQVLFLRVREPFPCPSVSCPSVNDVNDCGFKAVNDLPTAVSRHDEERGHRREAALSGSKSQSGTK